MWTIKFSDSISFSVVLSLLVVLVPYMTLIFCTWKMIVTIKRHSQRVEQMRSTGLREVKRATTPLIGVILSYFVCYAPALTVNMIEMIDGHEMETWIDISTVTVMLFSHVNNPLIYGLMNPNFKNAVFDFLCFRKSRQSERSFPVWQDNFKQVPVIRGHTNVAD